MTGRRLAILGYHKIGPPPEEWWSWNYVPEAVFGAQLRHLRDTGWEPIGADQLLRGLDAPETLPARAALITFDDAYHSFARTALPWLRRLDFPSMLFVPTDFVGDLNLFDEDVEPPEAICDWDDLRELARAGVSIQSHTASHRALSELTSDAVADELARSKAALEDHLGAPVDVVAYPYGDAGVDPPALGPLLARLGYRAGCLYGWGVSDVPVADRFLLPRLTMGPDTDLDAELAAHAEAGPWLSPPAPRAAPAPPRSAPRARTSRS